MMNFKHSPWIWMIMALVLCSCSKEVRLDNWLTRKDGKWTISSANESMVEYIGNDSNVVEGTAKNLLGEFEFKENQAFSFDFHSELLGSHFASSGEYRLEDDSFTSYAEPQTYTDVYLKQWVTGTRLSSKSIEVSIRIEWWKHAEILFITKYELDLVRKE